MVWKKKLRSPQYTFNSEKVFLVATQPGKSIYSYLQTTKLGLTQGEVQERQSIYGRNEVVHEQKKNPFILFIKTFINPFIGVLTGLAIISLFLDVLMADPGEQEWTGVIIISSMVLFSAILRFWQEWRASEATDSLMKMVKNTCLAKRAGEHEEEIEITELVPGDIVYLAAGDMVPADIRIIDSKDLFISQASLTGESEPIEKFPEVRGQQFRKGSVIELDNICYMGSNVISGAAKGIVFETGNKTYLGTIAKSLVGHRATTAFDKGISKVSFLLIRFMLVMVPFVFFVNGFTKGDWFEAFIFAISVAVGLTPEMLPMIVTANLSKGAIAMSKKKTIVKNLNAIQNFGAMDILCTDKTGTLTTGRFEVTDMLAHGIPEPELLALLLSVEQKSTHPIAQAIVRYAKKQNISAINISEMHELAGHGMEAIIGGQEVLVGNIRLMTERRISIPEELSDKVATVVICAIGKKYAGHLLLSDTLKDDAVEAIAKLRKLGVTDIRLLSGDKKEIVESFAKRLDIDLAYGNLLPEDKVTHIREMVEEPGKSVAFVGDGMNDAPVLALSHVGIAMGGLGSDAAIESADVVIQNDQPSKVATAIAIGRKTRTIVRQNIIGALGVKGIVLLAGALGYVTLWGAVFADVGVALLAVFNSVRILNRKVW